MRNKILPLLISISLLSGCSAIDLVVPQYYKSDVAIRARKADEQRVADFNSGVLNLTPSLTISQPTVHLQTPEQVAKEDDLESCKSVAHMASLVSVLRDNGIAPLDAQSRIHVPHEYPLDPIMRDVYSNPRKTPGQAQMAVLSHCTTIGYVAMVEELNRKNEDHMMASLSSSRKDRLSLKLAMKISTDH